MKLNDLQFFLTLAQAIDAVAADFEQYGPQPDLFHKIGALILGKDFKTCILNGSDRAWIRRNTDQPFEPVNDEVLGFYLIHVLETFEKDAASMAQICTLVFETPARPGEVEGESGVWIENQMNGFVCKRCGNCCRRLENACAQEDWQLWESIGRSDILSWVKKEPLDNGKVRYSAWVDPQTGRPAESCPFLGHQPGTDIFFCNIHAVKPLVCREYPYTKKHARNTGCRCQ
ncbi:YkgJ family cysteine cluster protein [Desulfobacula sp.]|uniref:YkgJ family cysteine cluster protein n=1 Tax=Desulfobacula sp. TaxID=2593537 RepID=UPI001EB87C3F|nr:YkgJ family cysteine cluster protein [Desulfobacula sp.]